MDKISIYRNGKSKGPAGLRGKQRSSVLFMLRLKRILDMSGNVRYTIKYKSLEFRRTFKLKL